MKTKAPKYTQREVSVAGCVPIGAQRATNTVNSATNERNGSATTSLKALALQCLQRNKQSNGQATDTEKQRNETGHFEGDIVAQNEPSTTLLDWYLSHRDTLNPDDDLTGYRNSKLSEPMELVDLILKEKPDYWMRTNGDLEHCLEIIMRHVAGNA